MAYRDQERWLKSAEARNIPADKVLALAVDIKRHRKGGDLDFANSLFAEYGTNSTVGRILDKSSTLNTMMLFALERVPAISEMPLQELHDPQPDAPPSDAAATMTANRHEHRNSLWLAPMPPACREAARAYVRERIDLLSRTYAMTRHPRLPRELKSWNRLADEIGAS